MAFNPFSSNDSFTMATFNNACNAMFASDQNLTEGEKEQARANIGAAPSGYGLGEGSGKNITDANTAVNSGWYYWGENAANTPFNYGCMRVDARASWGGRSVMQIAYCFASLPGYTAQRMLLDGAWGEWEYVNPPMALGTEYRTTERYLGKPVYRQVVQIASLVLNTDNTVQTGVVSGCTLVDARIFVKKADGSQTCIPQMETTENATINAARYWLRSSGVLVVHTYSTAEAGSSVTAELAYIKGTD